MNKQTDNIFYQDDSIELEFQLFKNKTNKEAWDLTNYKIRFQLGNGKTIIKKSTANVNGGSDDEIQITDAVNGGFVVMIDTEETKDLEPTYYEFAIQIESPEGKKITVITDTIKILKRIIDWENE
jgi:hypothetical protein